MPPVTPAMILLALDLAEKLLNAFDPSTATPEEVKAVRERRDAVNERSRRLDGPTRVD